MTAPALRQPLPRALDATVEPEKWEGWILAPRGHGPEWNAVFQIGLDEAGSLWKIIRGALGQAPVTATRDHGELGVTCEVRLRLRINDREAPVITAWHYDTEASAPRLVTAYPVR